MYSIKPGRGPSGMGAVGGIFAVIFGIFWTILAYNITKSAPFPMVGVIFPLFGVIFVISGIVGVIYNFNNATREDRFSVMDITSDREEPDPLNQKFGRPSEPAALAIEDRLKQIDKLKSSGLISTEEHATQRKRILGEI